MRTSAYILFSCFILMAGVSCDPHGHPHGDPAAASGHGHGHAHGAVSVTVFTGKSELFMEYPPLVAGESAEFLGHVTVLSDFSPLTEGSVRYVATGPEKIEVPLSAPTRPGIWIPSLTFPKAGEYDLVLHVSGPQLEDVIPAGTLTVYASLADMSCPGEEEAAGVISFLKEQQWKVSFGTAFAEETDLRETLHAFATVKARPDRKAAVVASVDGKYLPPEKGLPLPGGTLKKGDLLGSLHPLLQGPDGAAYAATRMEIEKEMKSAGLRLERAEKELKRVETLYQNQIKAKRDLDDAELEVKLARTAVEVAGRIAAELGSSTGLKEISLPAPIAGTLVKVHATPGTFVEAGTPLFSILRDDVVWIEAGLFEEDVAAVSAESTASFVLTGSETRQEIAGKKGSLAMIGSVVDPDSRTVPVVFEFRPDVPIRIGSFVDLRIDLSVRKGVVALPASAILEEGGGHVVYVQLDGESYEKRTVVPGIRDRGMVEIRDGVRPGERIVTTGAYLIRLASLDGSVPSGHGHPH